jgi:hypothetical protein
VIFYFPTSPRWRVEGEELEGGEYSSRRRIPVKNKFSSTDDARLGKEGLHDLLACCCRICYAGDILFFSFHLVPRGRSDCIQCTVSLIHQSRSYKFKK